MVPVLQSVVGGRALPSRVWVACCAATVGVLVISSEGAGAEFISLLASWLSAAKSMIAPLPLQLLGNEPITTQLPRLALQEAVGSGFSAHLETTTSVLTAAVTPAATAATTTTAATALDALRGDAFVALSAVFYSCHVLRLGAIAPRVAPLRLATAKAGSETLMALAAISLLASVSMLLPADWVQQHVAAAADLQTFVDAVRSGRVSHEEWVAAAGASVWCGAVTCGYTIWAQSFGQRSVPAVEVTLAL